MCERNHPVEHSDCTCSVRQQFLLARHFFAVCQQRFWKAAAATDQTATPKTSAHEIAFDLSDVSKLLEKALLIGVEAERSGFGLA